MSVEQLNLKEGNKIFIARRGIDGCVTLDISNGLTFNQFGLDRSQAHLLMLWLQEHLK